MIVGEGGLIFATIGISEVEVINGAMQEAVHRQGGHLGVDTVGRGEQAVQATGRLQDEVPGIGESHVNAAGKTEGEQNAPNEGLVIDNSDPEA